MNSIDTTFQQSLITLGSVVSLGWECIRATFQSQQLYQVLFNPRFLYIIPEIAIPLLFCGASPPSLTARCTFVRAATVAHDARQKATAVCQADGTTNETKPPETTPDRDYITPSWQGVEIEGKGTQPI